MGEGGGEEVGGGGRVMSGQLLIWRNRKINGMEDR